MWKKKKRGGQKEKAVEGSYAKDIELRMQFFLTTFQKDMNRQNDFAEIKQETVTENTERWEPEQKIETVQKDHK